MTLADCISVPSNSSALGHLGFISDALVCIPEVWDFHGKSSRFLIFLIKESLDRHFKAIILCLTLRFLPLNKPTQSSNYVVTRGRISYIQFSFSKLRKHGVLQKLGLHWVLAYVMLSLGNAIYYPIRQSGSQLISPILCVMLLTMIRALVWTLHHKRHSFSYFWCTSRGKHTGTSKPLPECQLSHRKF